MTRRDTTQTLLGRLFAEIQSTATAMDELTPLLPVLIPAAALLPVVWSASTQAIADLREGATPEAVARDLAATGEPLARDVIQQASDTVTRVLLEDPRVADLNVRLQKTLVALAANPHVTKALRALQQRLMSTIDRVVATLVNQAFEDQTHPALLDSLRVFEELSQRFLTFAIDRTLHAHAHAHATPPTEP